MSRADKPRVLLVDDEPDILDFLDRVLRRSYAVTRAASALEALEILAAAGARFDILITDQKMPRMSGLELLAEIASTHPAMTRVLISGYTDSPEIAAAMEDGHLHAYILKPVDSGQVADVVDQAHRANRARSA